MGKINMGTNDISDRYNAKVDSNVDNDRFK